MDKLGWEVPAFKPLVHSSATQDFFAPARRVARCWPFSETIGAWERLWGVHRYRCLNSFKNLAVALQNHHDTRRSWQERASADSVERE